jgi:hypothetical protein
MSPNDAGRKASAKAIFALTFYLIIPAVAIYLIISTYPELGADRYRNMVYWFIPLSISLVIVSQLSIRYPKGDKRRFMLNIAYVLITLVWLLAFLGGSLVVTDSWGEYEFSLHLWKYVLLIIAVALLNILYYVLEWLAYKDDLGTEKDKVAVGSMSVIPLIIDD